MDKKQTNFSKALVILVLTTAFVLSTVFTPVYVYAKSNIRVAPNKNHKKTVIKKSKLATPKPKAVTQTKKTPVKTVTKQTTKTATSTKR